MEKEDISLPSSTVDLIWKKPTAELRDLHAKHVPKILKGRKSGVSTSKLNGLDVDHSGTSASPTDSNSDSHTRRKAKTLFLIDYETGRRSRSILAELGRNQLA